MIGDGVVACPLGHAISPFLGSPSAVCPGRPGPRRRVGGRAAAKEGLSERREAEGAADGDTGTRWEHDGAPKPAAAGPPGPPPSALSGARRGSPPPPLPRLPAGPGRRRRPPWSVRGGVRRPCGCEWGGGGPCPSSSSSARRGDVSRCGDRPRGVCPGGVWRAWAPIRVPVRGPPRAGWPPP